MTAEIDKLGDALITKLFTVCSEELDKTDDQGRRSSAWGAVARQLLKDCNIQAPASKPEVKTLVDSLPSFEDDVPFQPGASH